MTRDPLDDLLDSSASPTRPAADADLRAMIAAARVRAVRRPSPRVLVASGIVAALLVTGAGTAAATDGFSWAPWAHEALAAVPFTTSSGLTCEIRLTAYTGGADTGYVDQVNAALRDWYATADVLADVSAQVPAVSNSAAIPPLELNPGETMETLPPGEWEHRQWVREWMVWDLATGEAESAALASRGFVAGDPRMAGSERRGQIQCLDLDGRPYPAGDGS